MPAPRSFRLLVLALALALACSSENAAQPNAAGAANKASEGGSAGAPASNGGLFTAGSAGNGVAGALPSAAGTSAGAASGLGGSGGSGGLGAGAPGDDAQPILPTDLVVMPLSGGNGDLDVVGLTLQQGDNGLEVYAALKNEGEMPACDAGLSVDLYDKNQQPLAASLGALLNEHLYQLTDGSGTLASCAGPGEVAFGAITDLPAGIAVDDVGYIVYHCNYFGLPATLVDAFVVKQVAVVTNGDGPSYKGTFVNDLAMSVTKPVVSIFPQNSVGRPLGLALASGAESDSVPSGGSWDFQTDSVDAAGTAYTVCPQAALAP